MSHSSHKPVRRMVRDTCIRNCLGFPYEINIHVLLVIELSYHELYLRNIECQPQKMRILNGRILKIIFITEQLRKNYESAESDRKLLITEMQRLRTQYEDLIKQLEQTQVIVDQQKVPVLSWYTLSPRTFFQLVYCTSEYGSSQKLLD